MKILTKHLGVRVDFTFLIQKLDQQPWMIPLCRNMHAFMNRGSRKTACCGSPFHISSHLTVIDNKLTGTPKFKLIFGFRSILMTPCVSCVVVD